MLILAFSPYIDNECMGLIWVNGLEQHQWLSVYSKYSSWKESCWLQRYLLWSNEWAWDIIPDIWICSISQFCPAKDDFTHSLSGPLWMSPLTKWLIKMREVHNMMHQDCQDKAVFSLCIEASMVNKHGCKMKEVVKCAPMACQWGVGWQGGLDEAIRSVSLCQEDNMLGNRCEHHSHGESNPCSTWYILKNYMRTNILLILWI